MTRGGWILAPIVVLLLQLVCFEAKAQGYTWSESIAGENPYEEKVTDRWFVTFQYGGSLAFGDDSWHVTKDFKNANGSALSVSAGYRFSDFLAARAKFRSMKLYSRTNLEFLEANKEENSEYFPRDGFYGYNAIAVQGEAMFNLAHLLNPGNPERRFNAYLILGGGVNVMSAYDPHVSVWHPDNYDNRLLYGSYVVDTSDHTMPCGVGGLQLEYKLNKYLSLSLEALGTFTGDLMEGVKYEEAYDVYITYSGGLTVYF